jgi:hypothetical protein
MKAMRIFLVAGVVFLSLACSVSFGNHTTGSGKVITEKRVVSDFTSIDLSCSADLQLEQGSPLAVSIEGEDNIVPLIETPVSGGVLHIDAKPNTAILTTRKLIVYVTVPELESLRLTGSGDAEVGEWEAGSLKLETSGSGDILFDGLQADSITARTSGSGDITIRGGQADDQSIHTSGSGDYNAGSLQSGEAEVVTSGSGDVTVWAEDELTATTSGSGDISYYGSPRVSEHETGSGDVYRRGDRP